MLLLRSLEGLWLSHFPGRVQCSPAPAPAAFGRGQLLSCKSWGTHGLCLFLYGKEFPLCSWLCLAARGGTRTSSRRLSLVLFWAGMGCQGMCCTGCHPAAILGREYEEDSDLPDSSHYCVPKNLKKVHFRQEEITAEDSSPSTTLFFKLYLYLRATCYFP